MNVSEFDQIDILGYGNFGQVKLVRHIESKKYYALKIIKKEEINKPK